MVVAVVLLLALAGGTWEPFQSEESPPAFECPFLMPFGPLDRK